MSFDVIVRGQKAVTTKVWREALAAVGVRCRFPARFSLASWGGGALPLRVSAKAGDWFRDRVVDEEVSIDVGAGGDVTFSSSGDLLELGLQCALAGTLAERSQGALVDTWSGESAESSRALEFARTIVARERARLGDVVAEVPFAKRVFDRLTPSLHDFRVTHRRASGVGFVRVRDGVRIVVNFRRHHEDSVLYEAFFSIHDAFARAFPRSVDGPLPVPHTRPVRNAPKSTTPSPRPAKVVSWKDGKEITVPWTRPAPLPPWEVQTDELMVAIRVGIDACSTLPGVRAELERSVAQASTRGSRPSGCCGRPFARGSRSARTFRGRSGSPFGIATTRAATMTWSHTEPRSTRCWGSRDDLTISPPSRMLAAPEGFRTVARALKGLTATSRESVHRSFRRCRRFRGSARVVERSSPVGGGLLTVLSASPTPVTPAREASACRG